MACYTPFMLISKNSVSNWIYRYSTISAYTYIASRVYASLTVIIGPMYALLVFLLREFLKIHARYFEATRSLHERRFLPRLKKTK